MIKVYIATSRPIGEKCIAHAKKRMPKGYQLTDVMEDCDILISVMYDTLLTEEFIKSRRCYNFHPGILPRWRGCGAFSMAILNGDENFGITLHQIDAGVDTGYIISTLEFPILPTDDVNSLFQKGMVMMYNMFTLNLPSILVGDYGYATPSKEGYVSNYTSRRELEGKLDITNMVRAFSFPGKSPLFYTDRNGNKVTISW